MYHFLILMKHYWNWNQLVQLLPHTPDYAFPVNLYDVDQSIVSYDLRTSPYLVVGVGIWRSNDPAPRSCNIAYDF